MKRISLPAATIGLSLALASSHAGASYTFLKPNLSEAAPNDVFQHLYGGSFSQVGLDYTNGTTTARRVHDDADQFWTGKFDVSVVGRFSGFTQTLGSLSEGKYQDLVEAGGLGFEPAPITRSVTLNEGVWVRSGDSGTHASAPQYNEDGRDHMVSYEIEGLGAKADSRVWVLFWEDLDASPDLTKGRSASDFNDLVVSIRRFASSGAPSGGPVAVPLPGPIVGGLAGLAISAFVIRRKLR
jgi:hypothetical protein